jgi:hypothetical protein
MSTLKFNRPEHWARIERHLASARGERFAFALTKMLHNGQDGPVLEVVDVILIDDTKIESNHDGWYLSEDALDAVHNQARSTGRGLVEFHNHRAGPPGFSVIDLPRCPGTPSSCSMGHPTAPPSGQRGRSAPTGGVPAPTQPSSAGHFALSPSSAST